MKDLPCELTPIIEKAKNQLMYTYVLLLPIILASFFAPQLIIASVCIGTIVFINKKYIKKRGQLYPWKRIILDLDGVKFISDSENIELPYSDYSFIGWYNGRKYMVHDDQKYTVLLQGRLFLSDKINELAELTELPLYSKTDTPAFTPIDKPFYEVMA